MKSILTRGIVLSRTDYGEADRILTLLTPDHGKLRLMARGVRKPKAKLAGSIELFSTADITFMEGKGEIGTLISARLIKHYGDIIQNIERVQLGYELIKTLNKATEDHPEAEYFELLEGAFAALDDDKIEPELIRGWFQAQLLQLGGHSPNLKTDGAGQKLAEGQKYGFDIDTMAFVANDGGKFTADHIKVLRLLFGRHQPKELSQVQGLNSLLTSLSPLIQGLLQSSVRT